MRRNLIFCSHYSEAQNKSGCPPNKVETQVTKEFNSTVVSVRMGTACLKAKEAIIFGANDTSNCLIFFSLLSHACA